MILALLLTACQTNDIVPKSQGVVQGEGLAYRWDRELWIADVNGQNARRLTANLADAGCAAYAPAPNGRSIAFRDRDSRLWVAPLPAGEARRLSTVAVEDFAWYPSSKGLAYSSGSELYLETVTRSARPDQYSLQGRVIRRPTWSPDNSRIAFYMLRERNQADLALLPSSASSTKDVLILDSFTMRSGTCPPEILWAPDSKKLVAGDGTNQSAYFLAGGSPLPLGTGPAPAAWSSDSRFLAYLDARGGLLLRDVPGGDVRTLVREGVGRYAWSRNGNSLAFTLRSAGVDQLALFQTGREGYTILLENAVALDLAPAWSYDGATIFFGYRPNAGPPALASIAREGGAVRQLLSRVKSFRLFERRSE